MLPTTCPHCGADVRAHVVWGAHTVAPRSCADCGCPLRLTLRQRWRRWWADPKRQALALVVAWIVLAVWLATTAGCATPRIEYVDRPVEVPVDRFIYVAVPDELLPDYPVATGPLEQCPAVASARRLELEHAQANTRAIRAIRGTEVPADQVPDQCKVPAKP